MFNFFKIKNFDCQKKHESPKKELLQTAQFIKMGLILTWGEVEHVWIVCILFVINFYHDVPSMNTVYFSIWFNLYACNWNSNLCLSTTKLRKRNRESKHHFVQCGQIYRVWTKVVKLWDMNYVGPWDVVSTLEIWFDMILRGQKLGMWQMKCIALL